MDPASLLSNVTYAGLFFWVLAEQGGLPIPCFPILLATGTFISSGRMGLLPSLLAIVAGSLIADFLWFAVGRSHGVHILHFLARLSWKPNTCVAKTKAMFSRHGAQVLLFAKFVPGLNTLAPPLAGAAGLPARRFIAFDIGGICLWCAAPLLAGMGLWKTLPDRSLWFGFLREHFALIFAGLAVLFLLWRFVRRRIYLRDLHREIQRSITPRELKSMIERGEDVAILDIRHSLNFQRHPVLIPGARHVPHDLLEQYLAEVPLEHDVIVYCDCPGSQAAFHAVRLLRQLGVKSLRGMRGGLEGWEAEGFETVPAQA
ncbi:MAG: VTT domain-containing protein [Verrucomicrobium sp.]|nr:VTT domain-containing protein [Verrucomicrobium sp.]